MSQKILSSTSSLHYVNMKAFESILGVVLFKTGIFKKKIKLILILLELKNGVQRSHSEASSLKKCTNTNFELILFSSLSYDVAVFQWITSCHKNRMTTRVITLLREYVTSLTTSVTTM